ncbi:helix-turn-helix domain-containing protein [Dysgonomonas capnocytophagoides]|uniref:helix-turn-helix domain-containing protein n=1 Tax=Dysgonomonas capnocytophagoides TaxID=45254 RepID=UPI00291DAFF9|nr:helix-turn-helix domain-containing protein [Dysgonomonas capnocytophagoides]
MEAITFKDQQILDLHKSLEQVSAALKNALDECRPLFNGESYLTDRNLSKILKISRRTLQDYRSNGIIPYIMLGGKVLYRESDIRRMLDNAYNKA